ncbi:MAG: adenosylhomocysteinase [Candidatus Aenigmarchaeota archaeon]|nr:adenosylhomocysteinase [Candidatus Aenigmarchaeota archaeon]
MSKVKDIKLAKEGKLKIEWAESRMPVLMSIMERFRREKPLKGTRISCCLHVTKETAVLMLTLKAGGARVALCGSNPLSTQDDVAAALSKEGIETYAWRGVNNKDYYWCVDKVLENKPHITMDDGGDLVTRILTKKEELLKDIIAGTEETTTGVIRFRAMEKDGVLKYPIIAVNDAQCKNMFDNYYGTGESALHAIIRATNILIPGKSVVVSGYGHCGQGVATFAKGMGAHTIITDVNPVNALRAYYDGHEVLTMEEAAKVGDVFITVTGCKHVITKRHFGLMKSGAILSNAGHFDVEIDVKGLKEIAKSVRRTKDCIEEITLKNGKKVFLLGEGRLVNLACAEGHPSEVMDNSFALQALSAEHIVGNKDCFETKVYVVPEEIDMAVARLKLKSLGVRIDDLTREQHSYLTGWKEGT